MFHSSQRKKYARSMCRLKMQSPKWILPIGVWQSGSLWNPACLHNLIWLSFGISSGRQFLWKAAVQAMGAVLLVLGFFLFCFWNFVVSWLKCCVFYPKKTQCSIFTSIHRGSISLLFLGFYSRACHKAEYFVCRAVFSPERWSLSKQVFNFVEPNWLIFFGGFCKENLIRRKFKLPTSQLLCLQHFAFG